MSDFTPKKLSSTNTKQQMHNAYNELLEEIEEKIRAFECSPRKQIQYSSPVPNELSSVMFNYLYF